MVSKRAVRILLDYFLVINNVIYSTIAVEGKSLSWASRVSPGPVICQATGPVGGNNFLGLNHELKIVESSHFEIQIGLITDV